MKASFKGRYDADKPSAVSTVIFNANDIKLRASITDATVTNRPNFNGLALAVEKPGFFLIEYNVPKKDFRFQFTNTVRLSDKRLNFTYAHARGDNKTTLDGTLVFDSANKILANHVLGTENCKLNYSYLHGGVTVFEPSYDWANNSLDFAVSHRVYGDDVLRASYQTSSKNLGLEWSRNSKFNGAFKGVLFSGQNPKKKYLLKINEACTVCPAVGKHIQNVHLNSLEKCLFNISCANVSASLNLAEEKKFPKLMAETSWNLEV